MRPGNGSSPLRRIVFQRGTARFPSTVGIPFVGSVPTDTSWRSSDPYKCRSSGAGTLEWIQSTTNSREQLSAFSHGEYISHGEYYISPTLHDRIITTDDLFRSRSALIDSR